MHPRRYLIIQSRLYKLKSAFIDEWSVAATVYVKINPDSKMAILLYMASTILNQLLNEFTEPDEHKFILSFSNDDWLRMMESTT